MLNITNLWLASFAALSFTLAPLTASAHDTGYGHQHQRHNSGSDGLVGGVIGALAGGIIGSEIAGYGNGTEGAIIGAAIGGITGAAIASDGRQGHHRSAPRHYRQPHYNTRTQYSHSRPHYSGSYYSRPHYSGSHYSRPRYSRPHYSGPRYSGPRYSGSHINVNIGKSYGHARSGRHSNQRHNVNHQIRGHNTHRSGNRGHHSKSGH